MVTRCGPAGVNILSTWRWTLKVRSVVMMIAGTALVLVSGLGINEGIVGDALFIVLIGGTIVWAVWTIIDAVRSHPLNRFEKYNAFLLLIALTVLDIVPQSDSVHASVAYLVFLFASAVAVGISGLDILRCLVRWNSHLLQYPESPPKHG